MIFEHRFETQTRGLVCGPSVLVGDVFQPLFIKRSQVVIADAKPRVLTANSFCYWKVVIESREGREILWQRPFENYAEALEVYRRLTGVEYRPGLVLPSTWVDGELSYYIATVSTYNSSNSTNADWPTGNKCPAGVTSVDYLVVAAGGGGGKGNTGTSYASGGGGAGGMRASTGLSVTPGTQYTITVGTGGGGSTLDSNKGTNGGDSTFSSITSTGGGGGGSTANAAGASVTNGSGGGGGGSAGAAGTGSTYGNNGGTASGNDAGGGGGAGGTGGNAASGTGGAGSSSSISGSSVTYAGGGGGGGLTGQSGGSGGGGAGGTHPASGTNGTANRGAGAGGGSGSGNGGTGGDGVIILSYTITNVFFPTNSPMLGM